MSEVSEGQRLAVAYAQMPNQATRDPAVAAHQRLCRIVARTIASGRHGLFEELTQVANVGLIEALNRYDPALGTQFASFAEVTIRGVVKHHMRNAWCLHTARATQELSMRLPGVTEACRADLRRTPTTAEEALRAGVTDAEVLDAREAGINFHALELNPGRDRLGKDDDLEAIDQRVDMSAMLSHLSAEQRQILDLRYRDQLVQTDIAALMGISQIRVSRQLIAALAHCRSYGPNLGVD